MIDVLYAAEAEAQVSLLRRPHYRVPHDGAAERVEENE